MKSLDICVPAYNEAGCIEPTIRALLAGADTRSGVEVRIIVADNGSTDGTGDKALRAGDTRVSLVHIEEKGKGAAIRAVAAISSAETFAFIDADLSASPDELFRLCEILNETGPDIVVGSRLILKEKVHRSLWRSFTSRIFSLIAAIFLPVGIEDSQCGLKIMNTRGREVLKTCRETGWFLDREFLFRSRRLGLSIVEVPIVWEEFRYPGRVPKLNVWRDGVLSVFAIVRTRFRFERK